MQSIGCIVLLFTAPSCAFLTTIKIGSFCNRLMIFCFILISTSMGITVVRLVEDANETVWPFEQQNGTA
jgi:hypothetical protein